MLPFAIFLGIAAGYLGGLFDDLIQYLYRDSIELDDLEDPGLISESFEILDNLTQIFNTGSIYSFQK